jgi:hypothetical protein
MLETQPAAMLVAAGVQMGLLAGAGFESATFEL